MQINVTVDVEHLAKDRLLAFHSTIGSAEHEGREFEITRSEAGDPTLGFYEKHGDTWYVALRPVIKAVLEAIVSEPQP